jgi:hypothetical protein
MTVTLYYPGQQPIAGNIEGFTELITVPFAQIPSQVATLLGCAYHSVDVLANGEEYVIYTVLDYEGEANALATKVVSELTGLNLDITDEWELLRGPVLIVSRAAS